MAERIINVSVNGQQLDDAIEKANQLKSLLQEVKQLIDSLSAGTMKD